MKIVIKENHSVADNPMRCYRKDQGAFVRRLQGATVRYKRYFPITHVLYAYTLFYCTLTVR